MTHADKNTSYLVRPQRIGIDLLSAAALKLKPKFRAVVLSDAATGFVVLKDAKPFLVTNWHVVNGKDAFTGEHLDKKTLAEPDRLSVLFHHRDGLGKWVEVDVLLRDEDGAPKWLEHPWGRTVDVVAIELPDLQDVVYYPLDLALMNTDMVPTPAMPVSIIGYPEGLNAQNWPVWKTGHIASEPDLDIAPRLPAFLIDATTRGGMSGSPVLLRLSSGYSRSNGNQVMGGGVLTKFLGIYAGRMTRDSEVGRVFKARTIVEVLSQRARWVPALEEAIPDRNSRCPCGSGDRFKSCCGLLST